MSSSSIGRYIHSDVFQPAFSLPTTALPTFHLLLSKCLRISCLEQKAGCRARSTSLVGPQEPLLATQEMLVCVWVGGVRERGREREREREALSHNDVHFGSK